MQQLTLCASRRAASKLWLKLYNTPILARTPLACTQKTGVKEYSGSIAGGTRIRPLNRVYLKDCSISVDFQYTYAGLNLA